MTTQDEYNAQVTAENNRVTAANAARKPGPQDPSKYPITTGPNYAQYGEQPGYLYNPYTDHYVPDPSTEASLTGTAKPGFTDQLKLPLTIVGATGIGGIGGKVAESYLSNAPKVPGATQPGALLTLGKSNPAASDALVSQQPSLATTAGQGGSTAASGASQGGGLLNVGSSGIDPATGEVVQSVDPAAQGAVQSGGAAADATAAAPGALAYAGPAIQAGVEASNWYDNNGGKELIHGQGIKSGDWLDTYADANPITGWVNPVLHQIGLGSIGKTILGAQESTRQVQGDHTEDLLKQDPDNQAWQQYVSGMRAQNAAPPPDPSHPFADTKGNTYATFSDYKNSTDGLDAANLTGVYGNLSVYGSQWASLTPAQQQAVTQKNIDSDIYDSKKGEVVITDPQTAQANLQAVLNNPSSASTPAANTNSVPTNGTATTKPAVIAPFPAPQGLLGIGAQPAATTRPAVIPSLSGMVSSTMPAIISPSNVAPIPTGQTPVVAVPISQQTPAAIARSKTLSPGIGLDGKPISYGLMGVGR